MNRSVMWVVLGVFACSACAPAPCAETARASCEIGAVCADATDCVSEHCGASGLCEPGCESDDDCAANELCDYESDFTRGRRCSTACSGDFDFLVDSPSGGVEWEMGRACVDGQITPCAMVTDPEGEHCFVCGCDGGRLCSYVEGYPACIVPRELGETCEGNDQCASANCSGSPEGTSPRACQVAAGTACTMDDATCRHCDGPSGAMACRQSCESDTDCGGSPYDICLGSRTTGNYACYRICDAEEPCRSTERCTFIESDPMNRRYCAPQ
ncbi:MAG: hypothetical protein J0L92_04410 [Deltaproteobacteria bacterium]|nr:hypothetical protein [Deltaproteobacteria bacterium]